MATTIKDVARLAKVSYSTVSRILSDKPELCNLYSASTIARVRQAAKTLDYHKNRSAIELVTQNSHLLAVIIGATQTNYADGIVRGIQKVASEYTCDVIILYVDPHNDYEQLQAVRTATSRGVRAIFMLGMATVAETTVATLKQSNIPYLFLSSAQQETAGVFVTSNDFDIGYLATNHLIERGHRTIAIAGLDLDSPIGQLRHEGYQRALSEANIAYEPELVSAGRFNYMDGIQALKNHRHRSDLTAIIGGSDLVAAGVINEARHQGLQVPDDLSVIGIDGTDLCDIIYPQLTSIHQAFYDMGVLGAGMLFENSPITERYTPIKIKPGASVKPRA